MARAQALQLEGLNFNTTLTLTSHVSLDKILHLLEPQFYLIELSLSLRVKHLAHGIKVLVPFSLTPPFRLEYLFH